MTNGESRRIDYETKQAETYNSESGKLAGYDCEKCMNRGYFMVILDGFQTLKPCECQIIRKSLQIIKKSGLSDLLDEYTFDKFETNTTWQRNIKEAGLRFIDDTYGNWFFAGGQVGSGKSHICTAIVNDLMLRGNEALYMRWRDDVVSLKKSLVSDGTDYADEINRFKSVKVLYIDDFFKSEKGKPPTTADINLAFELLNHRYINKDLVTIISSEKFINELLEIDEAIGSRIYQRSKKYCVEVYSDKTKNIRLKGEIHP